MILSPFIKAICTRRIKSINTKIVNLLRLWTVVLYKNFNYYFFWRSFKRNWETLKKENYKVYVFVLRVLSFTIPLAFKMFIEKFKSDWTKRISVAGTLLNCDFPLKTMVEQFMNIFTVDLILPKMTKIYLISYLFSPYNIFTSKIIL